MTIGGRKQQSRPSTGSISLAPITTVEYLEAARPLARNDQLGVTVTKLYLSNWPASGVNLPQDDGCASLSAPRRLGQAASEPSTGFHRRRVCTSRAELRLDPRRVL